jgi:hypothetical protein
VAQRCFSNPGRASSVIVDHLLTQIGRSDPVASSERLGETG